MKKTVVELCPFCNIEVVMEWNTEADGYKAFCPYCGERLLLCDECRHRCIDKRRGDCNIRENGSCRFNLGGSNEKLHIRLRPRQHRTAKS